jgi:hypothetical protein
MPGARLDGRVLIKGGNLYFVPFINIRASALGAHGCSSALMGLMRQQGVQPLLAASTEQLLIALRSALLKQRKVQAMLQCKPWQVRGTLSLRQRFLSIEFVMIVTHTHTRTQCFHKPHAVPKALGRNRAMVTGGHERTTRSGVMLGCRGAYLVDGAAGCCRRSRHRMGSSCGSRCMHTRRHTSMWALRAQAPTRSGG